MLIRTFCHTLDALLATLTKQRSLRLVQRVARKKRVRSLETVGGGEGTKDSGSKIRDVVLQPGMGDSPGKFEGNVGTSGGRQRGPRGVKAGR